MSDKPDALPDDPTPGYTSALAPDGGRTSRTEPLATPKLARVPYSAETAIRICTLIATGHSLRAIERMDDTPPASAVYRWIIERPEFAEMYEHAKAAQMDRWAEEIIELGDDDSNDVISDGKGGEISNHAAVQRAKLKIDTRKWLMARLAPKKYSEKVTSENVNINVDANKVDSDLDAMTPAARVEEAKRLAQAMGLDLAAPAPKTKRTPTKKRAGLAQDTTH